MSVLKPKPLTASHNLHATFLQTLSSASHTLQQATAVMGAIGTVEYMDPEFLLKSRYGPASDVYGLGVTILQTLTGERAAAQSFASTHFWLSTREPHFHDLGSACTGALSQHVAGIQAPAPRNVRRLLAAHSSASSSSFANLSSPLNILC